MQTVDAPAVPTSPFATPKPVLQPTTASSTIPITAPGPVTTTSEQNSPAMPTSANGLSSADPEGQHVDSGGPLSSSNAIEPTGTSETGKSDPAQSIILTGLATQNLSPTLQSADEQPSDTHSAASVQDPTLATGVASETSSVAQPGAAVFSILLSAEASLQDPAFAGTASVTANEIYSGTALSSAGNTEPVATSAASYGLSGSAEAVAPASVPLPDIITALPSDIRSLQSEGLTALIPGSTELTLSPGNPTGMASAILHAIDPAINLGGNVVSSGSSDVVVEAIADSTIAISGAVTPDQVLATIAGQTVVADPSNTEAVVVGSEVLRLGGPAQIFGSTVVSLGSAGVIVDVVSVVQAATSTPQNAAEVLQAAQSSDEQASDGSTKASFQAEGDPSTSPLSLLASSQISVKHTAELTGDATHTTTAAGADVTATATSNGVTPSVSKRPSDPVTTSAGSASRARMSCVSVFLLWYLLTFLSH